MNKLKGLIVASLAVVLCVMCVMTNTFSWFSRPQTETGGALKWSGINYDLSTGENVTIKTYASTDGKTYGETEVTSFNETVSAAQRKYYRTDFMNKGAEQSVSLYLTSLTTSDDNSFRLGVNAPSRSFKSLVYTNEPKKVVFSVNQKNVYTIFQCDQSYVQTNWYLHYWGGDNSGDSRVGTPISVRGWNYDGIYYDVCYATVPYDSTKVKPKQGSDGWIGGDLTQASDKAVKIYKDNGNDNSGMVTCGQAASINTFYSSAAMTVGDTLSIPATGYNVSYKTKSGTNAVVSVSSSGKITAYGAGTETIVATSTGTYGDKITAECVVKVNATAADAKDDFPVVTNVKLAEGTASKPTVKSVYWYILNVGATSLTYQIPSIYVGL